MKISKYSIAAAFGAVMMALAGCAEEEIKESRAILPGDDEVVLPAAACEKTFTVYADGTWMVDVTEEWLSVTPNTGEGTMDVLIVAEENTGSEAREAKLVIKGASTLKDVEVTIKQKMDRFRTMSPITVTEAVALKEGDLAKIGGAQVMATTKKGFVISDGSSNIFVSGTASVKLGDIITVTGDVAKVNDLIGIVLDEATVTGNEEVAYPEARDVTAEETYSPGKVELVKAAASCASGKLTINGKQSAIIYNPAQDISGINKHEVEVTGYYIGVSSKLAAIALVSYVDNGATPIVGKELPYKDNFDWVAPFVQWDKDNGRTTGDSMGDKKTVNYGNAYAIPGFEDMFSGTMGYESMFYSSKTVYVCGGNYLKFSKTNYCNGVRLPAFAIDGSTDLRLTFDWGKNTGDEVELEVEIEGDGSINGAAKSGVLTVADEFTWKNEAIVINGATAATRICIRPTTYTGAVASDGKLHRWFIDNIEVVSLAGMKEANIAVEGTENGVITFEGLEPQDVNLTITSDSDFSVNTTANWLHLDVTEGLAGEPTAVVVSCDPSDLSTMRKDELTIKSGLSEKKIMVIQSAAGQQLDPLISVICSKPTDALLGEGDEFSVAVQANVEYQVEISDSWIKEVETPSTRASVEKSEHSFTLDVNLSGATRTGYIRFFNKESNVEAVVVVKQENFVPRVTVTYTCGSTIPAVPGVASTVMYHVDANIDFTVSADSWIKFPQTSCPKGVYDVAVEIEANTSDMIRTGKATVEFGLEPQEIVVNQYPAGMYYVETFDWVAPYVQQYIDAGKEMGDSMQDNKAYSIGSPYTTITGFDQGMEAAGLQSLYTTRKDEAIYPCLGNYMKFSKTHYMNGLLFPALPIEGTKDLTLTFDWACSNGDNVTLLVSLEGSGTIEGDSEFTPIAGLADSYEWQPQTVTIKGADSTTRVKIGPKDFQNKKVDNAKRRYFLDNIIIKQM